MISQWAAQLLFPSQTSTTVIQGSSISKEYGIKLLLIFRKECSVSLERTKIFDLRPRK